MNEVMQTVGLVLARTVLTLLSVLQFALLLRAIFSWFASEDNRFLTFLLFVTEPVVQPFRNLFWKLNWFQTMPLDMSFLAAVLFLWLLQIILSFVAF